MRIWIVCLILILTSCTSTKHIFEPAPRNLVAWNPFEASEPLSLGQAVSDRITYLAEPKGLNIWQHPLQTYYSRFGDCEDHALLLMVCLWEEGYVAYIIRGLLPDKIHWHAITAVIIDGTEYFLDPTELQVVLRTDSGLLYFFRVRWEGGIPYEYNKRSTDR